MQHRQQYSNSSDRQDPYAQTSYPPQNIQDQFNQQSTQFSQSDYHSARDAYPPPPGTRYTGNGDFEKSANPVSRGSVAAQMAAEGQIPKKEGLRMWRTDEHAGALMRGGRGKCCLRVCGCSLLLAIIIIVGVVASFLLWTRPPNITFNGVEAPTSGQEVAVQSNGFLINFNLNVLQVTNPNWFGAAFRSIEAKAYYSTAPDTQLGGGRLDNFEIPKNSNTTIHFPFTVNYTTTIDPNLAIVTDMATKCGFLSSSSGTQKLKFNYNIRLGLKVASLVIYPSFSSSTSIDCPLDKSDIEGILGSSVLSGLTGSRLAKRQEEQAHVARRAIDKVLRRAAVQRDADLAARRWTPVRLFV